MVNSDSNFADAPISLGEVRADKEYDSRLWMPRDALINLLRDIDTGKAKPVNIVISYAEVDDIGNTKTRFICAGPGGILVALGLLVRASFKIQEP